MDAKDERDNVKQKPVTCAELLARVPPISSVRGYGPDSGMASSATGGRLRGLLSKGIRRVGPAIPWFSTLFGIGSSDKD